MCFWVKNYSPINKWRHQIKESLWCAVHKVARLLINSKTGKKTLLRTKFSYPRLLNEAPRLTVVKWWCLFSRSLSFRGVSKSFSIRCLLPLQASSSHPQVDIFSCESLKTNDFAHRPFALYFPFQSVSYLLYRVFLPSNHLHFFNYWYIVSYLYKFWQNICFQCVRYNKLVSQVRKKTHYTNSTVIATCIETSM